MPGQYDLTLKQLFQIDHKELISFFARIPLENPQPLNIEFQAIEGKKTDSIYRGIFQGKQIIVHFEFQSYNDKSMDYRMLRYAAEIYGRYKCPLFQEVIYIGAAPLKMPSSIYFNLAEGSKLDFSYRVLDLGSLSKETLIGAGMPTLYPFLPLTDRENRRREPRAFLRSCVRQILESPLSISQMRELLLTQELLSGLAFKAEMIEDIFKEAEQMIDLTQSAGYQRIIRKGEMHGFQKGELHGFQKGQVYGYKKGEAAALQKLLLSVLDRVLKSTEPAVEAEIMQLQDTQLLHNLTLAAIAADEEEFFRILVAARK